MTLVKLFSVGKTPAGGAAVDIVGILQAGHPLLQPHDLRSSFLNEDLRSEIKFSE